MSYGPQNSALLAMTNLLVNALVAILQKELNIPKTYKQALASPNSRQWQDAMDKEIKALKDNNTWKKAVAPPDTPILSGR